MTPILKVLTNYCDQYVDDVRLQEKASANKPVYAWTMWNYLLPQMALFTLPANMPEFLFGTETDPKLVEPKFDSYRYVAEEEQTNTFSVALGDAFKGYELFGATLNIAKDGRLYSSQPLSNASYDAENGTVTVTATVDNAIPQGAVIDFSFYTDGYFVNNLSPQVMSRLGICFEYGWTLRFENDWLSNVSKVEDNSFYEQNRANRMKAGDSRLVRIKTDLAEAMRRLEQTTYYRDRIKTPPRI